MKPQANTVAANRNRILVSPAAFLYTLLDPNHFESLHSYRPSPELRTHVEETCKTEWKISAEGFWTRCTPAEYVFQAQGWKIHISATEYNAVETLERVIPLLARERVAFKFASDRRMVRLSTSKNWSRSGGGKFLTIYPQDTQQFLQLIESCYEATKGLQGPYILSDRAYKDSRVVFYRYGGHKLMSKVDAHGFEIPVIASPNGCFVPDERVPFYRTPEWVEEPIQEDKGSSVSDTGQVKLKNRYVVTGAIKYSNAGGIYKGTDTETGQPIVVREARPFIRFGGADGTDAITLLKKEGRILQKLNETGITPRFVDLFNEWEHWFLVEEYLEAETLWGYTMDAIFRLYWHNPEKLFGFYRDIIVKLTRGLETVHEHQVVMRDFTKRNVMFTSDGQVKFIDFELAYELDRSDPPVAGSTEGYASPEQISNQTPTIEQDYYALGALILDSLAFTAAGLRLNRSGILAGLKQVLNDFALPGGLLQIVEGLINPDPDLRWRPQRVLNVLNQMEVAAGTTSSLLPPGTTPPPRPEPNAALKQELKATIKEVTRYIENKIEYGRNDRLWPASCEVFLMNPVNFEYGAAGIASYLRQTGTTVPDEMVAWILNRSTAEKCPPGLFVGLSGIAVFLLSIGEVERATQLLESSKERSRIYELNGLYEGAAGWGLANLHFWNATAEEKYLANALEVGERLVSTAILSSDGVRWEQEGYSPLGLAAGGSGIALYLTYLNAIHSSARWLETAERAIDYEMSQATWIDHCLYFGDRSEAPLSAPRSPHTRYGTAGLGTAAIRLFAATGKQKFRKIADLCAHTVSSRYTNKLWQDYGLAGFGEFLLDMFYFLREDNYLNNAFHIAEGILPYRIQRPEGTVFAGTEMLRICCDWGCGAAGIASFLHRLLHPNTPRLMLLDSVLNRAAMPAEIYESQVA